MIKRICRKFANLTPCAHFFSQNPAVRGHAIPFDSAQSTPHTLPSPVEWFRKFVPAGRPIWVAESDDQIGATTYRSSFYGGRAAYDARAEMRVHIASAYQRRGIGRVLTQFVIEECPRLGITTLLSMHYDRNDATRSLYESLGFQQGGHLPDSAVVEGPRRGLVIAALRVPPRVMWCEPLCPNPSWPRLTSRPPSHQAVRLRRDRSATVGSYLDRPPRRKDSLRTFGLRRPG